MRTKLIIIIVIVGIILAGGYYLLANPNLFLSCRPVTNSQLAGFEPNEKQFLRYKDDGVYVCTRKLDFGFSKIKNFLF